MRHQLTILERQLGRTKVRFAPAVLAWAETWVHMSADEELLSGPLTDYELARTRYGSSARQLRRLRKAVLSGALRQQAERLGVTLPHGFVDVPQIQAIEAPPGFTRCPVTDISAR